MTRAAVILAALLATAAGTANERGISLPPAERLVLDNGVVLILHEKHEVPMIGVHALVTGGAITDPAGKAGVSSLLAELLGKGAGDRSAADFAEAVDSTGGRLSAQGELETLSVTGDFLARDAETMVELLADMLMRPALDEDEFEKLRERRINLLRAEKDTSPGGLVPVYAHGMLFGDHPYAAPVDGSEASLAAISHEDVVDHYAAHVGADRLVVAVSGDFDAKQMAERLTAAFGDWRQAAEPLPEISPADRQPGGRVLLVDKPGATQTWFWVGNVGVSRTYPRRAALDIANTLFGGRFTSMLNTALRVETGLTYGAQSLLVRPSTPGSVGIDTFTRTEATTEAIDLALDVLERFRGATPPRAAVASARNYVLGQFPMQLETAWQLAGQFATIEATGLTRAWVDDYGEAVSDVRAPDVAEVASAVYPGRSELVFVLIGDAERIRDAVAKYGSVTEMSITEPVFRPPPAPEGAANQSK